MTESLLKTRVLQVKKGLKGTCLLFKFTCYLLRIKAFNDNSPATVLRVIQKFIDLSGPTYKEKAVVMGRNTAQSSLLLSALIDKWFKDKSKVALEQILEVLKNEFIGRK